jgi:hypothetical protein
MTPRGSCKCRRFGECVLRCLVTANVVHSSRILVTLMMGAIHSSEKSVITRRSIPEDVILHSHRRENLKSSEKSISALRIQFGVRMLDPFQGKRKGSKEMLVPRQRRRNHLTAITQTRFPVGGSCPTTGWSLCLLLNKKKLLLLNFGLKLQNFNLSSFMKKPWILSPVNTVRRMVVNLTWNFVDSDLPLGKTFTRLFQTCPIPWLCSMAGNSVALN